ncbi:MAG: hypothetical protein HYR73_08375 [Candidatus Eisenbacteria bacterium]|nr:hypothetical protein [Candidatus Eisenbacteria bacterium]
MPAGVEPDDREGIAGVVAPASRRVASLSWRGVLLLALGAASLLGQGERYRVNPRLISPSRTIASYWEALRRDDENAAAECTVEGNPDVPYPGMLWFLPPTSELTLSDFRSLPVSSGRVLVTYLVRYRPVGLEVDQSFVTGCELVRQHGEWRIEKPIGEASMPEWKPIPRAVDI